MIFEELILTRVQVQVLGRRARDRLLGLEVCRVNRPLFIQSILVELLLVEALESEGVEHGILVLEGKIVGIG